MQILLPHDKKQDLKVIYNLKIDGKKKCLVSKILKMDGNNQYGNVMTKPLFYGCIRKAKETPDLRLVNFVLQNLSVDDKIKPYERSVLQIQSVLAKNDKGTLKTFKFNEKPHSTMKKMFLPRYAEHLHLLITRAGCLVTKI